MSTSILEFREQCEKGARKYSKILENIDIKGISIDGIKAEWIIPEGASSNKIIVYIHGGGYVSGSCNDHRGFVSKISKNTRITSLLYEYRLAPEHPFPAAIDDSIIVYRWLIKTMHFDPENIIFVGESAGGGLCLSLLLALKDLNLPFPKAAVVISPWLDLSCSSESYKTKNNVSPAPKNSWIVFSKHYVGSNDVKNYLISPLYGDLRSLPPIFINAGVDDELFDEAKKFYLKAKEANVDITFRAGYRMVHCYPLLAPLFIEATNAMNEICVFITKKLCVDD